MESRFCRHTYFMRFLLRHPLLATLAGLRGNARACVYTEPMWGFSMNLCLPYLSVFMITLGLSDTQVGIVSSVYMTSQILFSFLSGALTDKFGRRKSVAVFDAIGWSIPCIVWFFAVDFKFFLVAAIFNGAMRVPMTAFNCLIIEDTDKSKITHIYTLIMICGSLSALLSPITSQLISMYTLIPAIRILLVNAFVVMTTKIFLLYFISRETSIGKARLIETKKQSYASILGGYFKVLGNMRGSRGLIFAITIASLFTIISSTNSTFWQIIVSRKLEISDKDLPIFTMIRAIISLFFYFTVITRIRQTKLKNPLLTGFAAYFTGQLILLLIPSAGAIRYVLLCVSLVCDGLGAGILVMLSEAMVAIHAGENERASVLAINQMIIMAICAPFGWIAGMLSNMSRSLPFILNLLLICAGVIITLIHFRSEANYAPSE